MSNESANVRFRIAAAITQNPTGQRKVLTPVDWSDRFREALAGLRVEVTDRLGAGPTRHLTLSPRGLSDLTLAGIIKNDPALTALAEHARKSPGASPEAWIAAIEGIVGKGALAEACRSIVAPPAPAGGSTAAPQAGSTKGDAVDALFEQAEEAKASSKTAVDAFVRAMRPEGSAAGSASGAASPAIARQLRDALEAAVYGTARDVLSSPALARLESTWRATRWLMDHTPAAAGLRIEILDVAADGALDALEALPSEEDFEEPDLFVLADTPSVEHDLARVAAFGERRMAPCIVSVPRVLADLEPDPLSERLGAVETEEGKRHAALRADESARWLTVVYDEVLVFHEGTGALARDVLASPAWGLVAMLAASYAATGSFARVTGQHGQLRAPATRTLSSGRETDVSVPTRYFASVRAQTELAQRGVVALGSPRNSDKLALGVVPTYRASRDAVPLPAQIWTGRIVRFAQWAGGQLPAGASSEDAGAIFEQAGSVFLFPGTGKAARVTAEISETNGVRQLQVAARMDGSLAMVPLQIEFALPLR